MIGLFMEVMKKILLVYLLNFGCAAINNPGYRFELEHDSVVRVGDQPGISKKAGEFIETEEDTILIESEGRVGMVIYPVKDAEGLYKISLKPVESFGGAAFNKVLNSSLNNIVGDLNKIQVLMSEKKGQEALSELKILQEKYPEITYLSFLEASCHYIMGNKESTIQALSVALTDFPNDAFGRSLYATLKGIPAEVPLE